MDMYDKIDELYKKRREVELGGGSHRIEKQYQKGKKTARDRIRYLLDEDSFVELSPFMESREFTYDTENDGKREGIATDYRNIKQQQICLFAEYFTVYLGAFSEIDVKKIPVAVDLAAKNGFP